jgi:hypothetical protein
MHRLYLGQGSDAHSLAPRQELRGCPGVGPQGVRIANLRGEELHEAYAGALAGVRHHRRNGDG